MLTDGIDTVSATAPLELDKAVWPLSATPRRFRTGAEPPPPAYGVYQIGDV